MTEEQILADGYFVRLEVQPREKWCKPVFTGIYVIPKEANIETGHKVCIETQVIHGETKFWGKIEALRIALTNKAQYDIFLSMAWDLIN